MNEGLDLLGQQLSKNSVPVVFPSDGSATVLGHVITDATSVTKIQDAAGNSVTSGSTATASATAPDVNLLSLKGTAIVTGGKSGVPAVAGTDGSNVAPTANPLYVSGLGQSSEPAANTTGRITALFSDLSGKPVTSPYANRENYVKGSATATNTTSTSLIATAGSGLKNWITSIAVANTGATTVEVNIQDGSGGTTIYQCIAPAGGGGVYTLPVPIATTANTAAFFAASGSTTTLYVSAAGYKGY